MQKVVGFKYSGMIPNNSCFNGTLDKIDTICLEASPIYEESSRTDIQGLQTKYPSTQRKSGVICDRLIIRRRFIATIEPFQLTPQEDIKGMTRLLSIILSKVMFYHVFSTQAGRPMEGPNT